MPLADEGALVVAPPQPEKPVEILPFKEERLPNKQEEEQQQLELSAHQQQVLPPPPHTYSPTLPLNEHDQELYKQFKDEVDLLENFLKYVYRNKKLALQCVVSSPNAIHVPLCTRLHWIGKSFVSMLESLSLLRDNRQADPVVLDLLAKRNQAGASEIDKKYPGWSLRAADERNQRCFKPVRTK